MNSQSRWMAAGVAALLCATQSSAADDKVIDRNSWVADLDALRDALTQRYANLEWSVERGMNLPAVERRARARLDAATTDYEARRALERFIESFADGHLELTWPRGPSPRPANAPSSQGICESRGYANPTDEYAIGPQLPGYMPLVPDTPTLAGTFNAEGKKVAVLRIERFSAVGAECARALAELEMAPTGACDEACGDRVSQHADLLFVTNFQARLRQVAAAKPDLLVVDISRNGGGNDSAIALARMLGGDLPSPEVARVRSDGLAQNLADKRAEIRKALPGAPPADRELLAQAERKMATAEAEARQTCDRSPLWRGDRVPCSALVRGPFYAAGLVARPLPARLDGDAGEIMYAASRYTYTPGLWQGPLAIIIDGNTASSAELFAAMLQDSGRAIVVGSPSAGAGCGWMLPVAPVTLPNSKGKLVMPDCSRYRANGRNEVDGITPDVAAGLRPFDTPRQRGERFMAVLPEVLAKAASKRSSGSPTGQ